MEYLTGIGSLFKQVPWALAIVKNIFLYEVDMGKALIAGFLLMAASAMAPFAPAQIQNVKVTGGQLPIRIV
jgi:hypothetical protein